MKQILSFLLFLLPALAFAQWPAAPNKIRLGNQTTGDGLIYRTDSIPNWTPADRNNAWLAFDTVANLLYFYEGGTWQEYSSGGGIDSTTASNGLTEVSNDIRLGGALTGNTTITGDFTLTRSGSVATNVFNASNSNGGFTSSGITGTSTGSGRGVYGQGASGYGVYGVSSSSYGVLGTSTTGYAVGGTGSRAGFFQGTSNTSPSVLISNAGSAPDTTFSSAAQFLAGVGSADSTSIFPVLSAARTQVGGARPQNGMGISFPWFINTLQDTVSNAIAPREVFNQRVKLTDRLTGSASSEYEILLRNNDVLSRVARIAPTGQLTLDGYTTNSFIGTGWAKAVFGADGTIWADTTTTGSGSFTSFTLAGSAGTPQTITDGNTLTLAAGVGITTTAEATDQVTIAADTAVLATLYALQDSAAAIRAAIFDTITMATSGAVGAFIYQSTQDNVWRLADRDADTTLAHAIIVQEINSTTWVIQTSGIATISGHGYSVGNNYSLSSTAGQAVLSSSLSTGLDQWLFTVLDANKIDLKFSIATKINPTVETITAASSVNLDCSNFYKKIFKIDYTGYSGTSTISISNPKNGGDYKVWFSNTNNDDIIIFPDNFLDKNSDTIGQRIPNQSLIIDFFYDGTNYIADTVNWRINSDIIITIDGLQLYLVADDINQSDSTAVTSWIDRKNLIEMVQDTTAKQPKYVQNVINGLSAVSFDGGDILAGGIGSWTADSVTVFFVGKSTSSTASQVVLGRWDASPAKRQFIFVHEITTKKIQGYTSPNGANPASITTSDSLFTQNYQLITWESKPTAQTIRKNGAATTNFTSNSSTIYDATQPYMVGGNYNNTQVPSYIGDICLIAIFNRVLTSTEITEIENYINSLYAIY